MPKQGDAEEDMPQDVTKVAIRMVCMSVPPANSARDLKDVNAHKACNPEGANAHSVHKIMHRQMRITVCKRCQHALAA